MVGRPSGMRQRWWFLMTFHFLRCVDGKHDIGDPPLRWRGDVSTEREPRLEYILLCRALIAVTSPHYFSRGFRHVFKGDRVAWRAAMLEKWRSFVRGGASWGCSWEQGSLRRPGPKGLASACSKRFPTKKRPLHNTLWRVYESGVKIG